MDSRTHIAKFLDLLVEPFGAPRSPEERYTARFAAGMTLAVFVLVGLYSVSLLLTPDSFMALIEIVVTVPFAFVCLGAYLWARMGSPRAAIILMIAAMSFSVFALLVISALGLDPLFKPTDTNVMLYLVLPVVIAAVTLTRMEAAVVVLAEIAAMLVAPLLLPTLSLASIVGGPMPAVLIVGALAIFYSAYRERIEAARGNRLLAEIAERRNAEERLARSRDELDALVRQRTASLERAILDLREADEAKDSFFAHMSHELRTPLNSILGFTGVVLQGAPGPLTDEQERQLTMVQGSAHQLLDLINQLLDLSRVRSGMETLTVSEFEVDDLLEEVSSTLEPLASDRGLELRIAEPRLNGVRMHSDRGKIRQVLINLVGNAIKFTESGGVTIGAAAIGGRVRLFVTDTGVGIDRARFDTIFMEYSQLKGTETGPHDGTGLGLAVSKGLTTLLGGQITVESEPGRGSTFTVEVPVGPASSEPLGDSVTEADQLGRQPDSDPGHRAGR